MNSSNIPTVCQILNRQYFWHCDVAIHGLFGLLITYYDCKVHISIPFVRSLTVDIFGNITVNIFGILMGRSTVYLVSLLHFMTAKVIYPYRCSDP